MPGVSMPALALVPRGQINHATRGEKMVAGYRPQAVKQRNPLGENQVETNVNSHEEIVVKTEIQAKSERRLGERFLTVMARLTRLASQSLETSLDNKLLPVTSRPKSTTSQPFVDLCNLSLKDTEANPLQVPIKRKRLRRRRRRVRCSWHTSHASWLPHASADYIMNHTKQDVTAIQASWLIEQLRERQIDAPMTSQVISMPLPPLPKPRLKCRVESVEIQAETQSDNEKEEENGASQENLHATIESSWDSTCSLNTDETAASCPQSPVDEAAPRAKQALYHQPAWISPELHAWLVESGMFQTAPRHSLVS